MPSGNQSVDQEEEFQRYLIHKERSERLEDAADHRYESQVDDRLFEMNEGGQM
jgi:hypothetical protein